MCVYSTVLCIFQTIQLKWVFQTFNKWQQGILIYYYFLYEPKIYTTQFASAKQYLKWKLIYAS